MCQHFREKKQIMQKSVAKGGAAGAQIDWNVSELFEFYVQFLALPRKFPGCIPDWPLIQSDGFFIIVANK